MTLQDHLGTGDVGAALRADVLAGLAERPRTLSPRWLYDERGSELFDQITRLPEYYPTRAERAILTRNAADIAEASRAETLVELGSGTSAKTRLLLSALREHGSLRRYVPVDVDPTVLRSAGAAVCAEYPGVRVTAVCADFLQHLGELPRDGRRLIAFLGSTIGNLEPGPRADFLATLAATMHPGDAFLLGTDRVKDPARLVLAYDDPGGVTADFNRNVLAVLNRELAADYDLAAYAHVAVWDDEHEWMAAALPVRADRADRRPRPDAGSCRR